MLRAGTSDYTARLSPCVMKPVPAVAQWDSGFSKPSGPLQALSLAPAPRAADHPVTHE